MQKTMNNQFDVIIIGGGVIGLAAALALHDNYSKMAIIEAKPLAIEPLNDSYSPRVFAINHSSLQLFKSIGVWEQIEKRLSPYEKMHVWEGMHHIEFNCRDVASSCLGFIIEESVIKNALLEKIKKTNIALLDALTLDQLTKKDGGIQLRAGQSLYDAKLLIGADGANSWVRQQLNVELNSWSYNHHAIIAHVECKLPHQKTAWQRFTSSGTLAFLPMTNEHHSSIVWSTTPTHANELLRLDDASFGIDLCQEFEDKLGKICHVGKRFSFPLKMRHVKQYVGENWLLVGDAAHTIHPLAGQGMNVGLKDVASLAQLAKKSTLSAQTLAKFQRQRKTEVWKIIAAMEGFKRLFEPNLAPISAIRGLGLSFCNHVMPIKRLFIEQAMN
jgi:2-polyprenylphenol 6-hydroxylase